ncbi:hypothetical protein EYF80_050430 [Liparis tanakae]|uniref:Uncharacterized protein n=1 Tax=Liparis tanakae TaxID=230148 RepID=A0A4Z2FE41_9TELE|nr:hypothetical protein EYF80_050430 [Liparis tanakae]
MTAEAKDGDDDCDVFEEEGGWLQRAWRSIRRDVCRQVNVGRFQEERLQAFEERLQAFEERLQAFESQVENLGYTFTHTTPIKPQRHQNNEACV